MWPEDGWSGTADDSEAENRVHKAHRRDEDPREEAPLGANVGLLLERSLVRADTKTNENIEKSPFRLKRFLGSKLEQQNL